LTLSRWEGEKDLNVLDPRVVSCIYRKTRVSFSAESLYHRATLTSRVERRQKEKKKTDFGASNVKPRALLSVGDEFWGFQGRMRGIWKKKDGR